jgi:hypothetical protein
MRTYPIELCVVPLAEEQLLGALDVEPQVRMGAGFKDPPPHLADERRRGGTGVDAHQVACLHPGRVVDEDVRQALDAASH